MSRIIKYRAIIRPYRHFGEYRLEGLLNRCCQIGMSVRLSFAYGVIGLVGNAYALVE